MHEYIKNVPIVDAIVSDDKNFVRENKTSTVIALVSFFHTAKHKFLARRYHNSTTLNQPA